MQEFDLSTFTSYQLAVVANRISQNVASLFEQEYEIQLPDWRILVALIGREFMTFKEVVESTSMDKSRVSRAYKRLAELDLIEVKAGPFDKRQVVMRLSQHGKTVCEQIIPKARERDADILQVLTDEERTHLQSIIQKLLVHTKDIVKTD
jgi:DNA-binding MarR family transcriptional regulator